MATIYGDAGGMLDTRARAQNLIGVDGENNFIYGDALVMSESHGGNDVLIGGALSFFNVLYGDAAVMYGSRGGNDVVNGGDDAEFNYLFGDSIVLFDSQGGNDTLTGGAHASFYGNLLYGDGYQIFNSQGGNDVMNGGSGSGSNTLYGDAYFMSHSQGGNDVLTGDANSYFNELYGDAQYISAGQGGNDILIAHANPSPGNFATHNQLYGDARNHTDGNVICGKDRLVSGTGNDAMWGDIAYSGYNSGPVDLTRVTTGKDVFVFSANNGNDTIHDFRQGEDKIELQGIGVASFDALMAASHLNQDSTNTVITFGSNMITVIGITEITAADFLFT
jgi:hypothetical protein